MIILSCILIIILILWRGRMRAIRWGIAGLVFVLLLHWAGVL